MRKQDQFSDQNLERLSDTKANGKERPWKERKEQSINVGKALDMGATYEYADFYLQNEYNMTYDDVYKLRDRYAELEGWLGRKSGRVDVCGDTLTFAINPDGTKKLYQAWFCKDRLCPLCNWRRSVKLTSQVFKMLEVMKEREIMGRPLLLTLSMENVKGKDIGKSFSEFAEGFHRLTKYKAVKDYFLGAIRSSEITYNSERDDYNTHIHCILWMKPNYFKKGYLSKDKWIMLWQRAVKVDYKPSVDVKAIKPKPTDADPTGYFKAVLEVTKYAVKPSDMPFMNGEIYNITDAQKMKIGEMISVLERGMFKKRLISFFGIFKELHKELDLDDAENGDLVGADENGNNNAVQYITYTYNRNVHDYIKD